jgi:hypothetical protein
MPAVPVIQLDAPLSVVQNGNLLGDDHPPIENKRRDL